MAVPLALSDRIAALREALPPDTAASILSAADLRRDREEPPLPSGVEGMDRLLAGGYARGKLIEVVGRRSSGRLSLALSALASATEGGENAALIDLGDGFDPQAASAADVDLRRVLWVRPRRLRDAVYAAEAVIAAGFPLVVAELGTPPFARVPDAAWVRLSRSARAHGVALLVATPYPVAGAAADAVVLLSRNRAHWRGSGASPKLLRGVVARAVLEKKRGEKPGRTAAAGFTAAEAIPENTAEDGRTKAPSPGRRRSPGTPAGRPLPPAWPKPLRRGEGPPGEAIALPLAVPGIIGRE